MLFICQGSVASSQQQLVHLSTSTLLCQQLFSRFFIFLSCLSELSLLPAALKNKIIFRLSSRSLSSIAFGILPNVFTFVNTFFQEIFIFFFTLRSSLCPVPFPTPISYDVPRFRSLPLPFSPLRLPVRFRFRS